MRESASGDTPISESPLPHQHKSNTLAIDAHCDHRRGRAAPSVGTGEYSPTRSLAHHRSEPKRYRYSAPRTNVGGREGNGFDASSRSTSGDPSRRRSQKRANQGAFSYVPSAANHICQSSRGWCGATHGGRRRTSPGWYLNSYGVHVVPSFDPSTMISGRVVVITAKRPYAFTLRNGASASSTGAIAREPGSIVPACAASITREAGTITSAAAPTTSEGQPRLRPGVTFAAGREFRRWIFDGHERHVASSTSVRHSAMVSRLKNA